MQRAHLDDGHHAISKVEQRHHRAIVVRCGDVDVCTAGGQGARLCIHGLGRALAKVAQHAQKIGMAARGKHEGDAIAHRGPAGRHQRQAARKAKGHDSYAPVRCQISSGGCPGNGVFKLVRAVGREPVAREIGRRHGKHLEAGGCQLTCQTDQPFNSDYGLNGMVFNNQGIYRKSAGSMPMMV